ncbi:Pls/PosA family non-ribosomal peptide synthetase [Actinoplanes subtropicus]|uniref:Pls/PosA family non-ribosomal peptide synthetase n=1 Tax=Actinoplanes subtropicus TaxID=543632 RepID=UPI00069244E6|nr:Pls/PosA family non-ribosomal peptide synthetase [Actinoplanes subtropicus]
MLSLDTVAGSQVHPAIRPALEPPSTAAVYSGGPEPAPRTLIDVLEATAAMFPHAPAIDDGTRVLDYRAMLDEASRLAGRLAEAGVGAGDRVGIRVQSGTADLYLSILAVLAVGAAYVPVDHDDPDDRAELVWSEAGVCAVVDRTGLRAGPGRSRSLGPYRPRLRDDAWIIFTSGTTGKPKGVAVKHRNSAAFVDAEARLFLQDRPLGPGDRVLAGLSVAFDASCEEMWLAWRHGACLVPADRTLMKAAPDLAEWLGERGITVVSTVPTMVALWPPYALDNVRLLILGGEACPAGLAERLAKGTTEVWNTYGPTEATVVACAARLTGDGPVRIGLPLAGWDLAVVDPDSGAPVGWGEEGELVIGGAGVARYLDAGKDAEKFPALPQLGWHRAYRSGDLVRADPEGLVFLGRADSQVKIRGYRVELSEIESVILQLPGIAQAAVTTYERRPGLIDLVAYYSPADDRTPVDEPQVFEVLRRRLPAHMIPAYLERLPTLPITRSGKIDRKRLPAPTGARGVSADQPTAEAATAVEKALADTLAEVLGLPQVSVESNLFSDLGANSLVIAHFCAALRQRADLPPVSTKDVYLHPTIRGLAATLPATAPPRPPSKVHTRPAPPPVSTQRYLLCGLIQALVLLGGVAITAQILETGLDWISDASGFGHVYLRSLVFDVTVFAVMSILPILVKWMLIGRWQRAEIPLWSLRYLRFWFVKTLVRSNPLVLFAGSPLYNMYLRALGARIGARAHIMSTTVPVCTDMLSIGHDAVVHRASSFTGYRAHNGQIELGPVSIGDNAFVGDRTVIDIGARVGRHAQLGHASALHAEQSIPDGERWHGSPAEPATTDYRTLAPAGLSRLRRFSTSVFGLFALLFVSLPVATAVSVLIITRLRGLDPELPRDDQSLFSGTLYKQAAAISFVLFFGAVIGGVLLVATVPRLLRRFSRPGRIYPLYGMHHAIHRAVRRISNAHFYIELLGDSSYIVGYLRAIGYRLARSGGQTGSNFGSSLQHDDPFLTKVGGGTQISDDVSFGNAEFTSSSFRVSPVIVGTNSFVGNSITFPTGARIGENILVATKAMIPLDGPVRSGVGLLGSPPFEIPRSVERDASFDAMKTPDEFRRRLTAKNRHNLVTMALFLAARWLHFYILTLIAMMASHILGHPVVPILLASLPFSVVYFIAVERATQIFQALRPRFTSIYDPYFWWHERYWKLQTPSTNLLNGTPMKALIWRALGVRVGKRLYDDGCTIVERSLVTIGDDAALNAGAVIQCHSMEDDTFKSDRAVVGSGCTLGVGAFVHYGTVLADHTILEADSFLMKGERTAAASYWGGNPAREL